MRFADSWGLRRHVLKPIRIKPGDLHQKNQAPLRGAISEQQISASAFSGVRDPLFDGGPNTTPGNRQH